MRGLRFFAVCLAVAVLFAVSPVARTLCADDEAEDVKQKVHFVSIEAKGVEGKTSITWEGDFGPALKAELENLAKQKGYTYFRIANEATKTIGNKTSGEYRLDPGYDYYFKPIIDSVKTWRDDDKVEHTYVAIGGPIVLRRDNKEKKTVDVKFVREIGSYYLLNFVMFYKHDDGEGNVTKTDLILAVAPKK